MVLVIMQCLDVYNPRFLFAWPTAKIAVMGGEQAAKGCTISKSQTRKNTR